MAEIISCPSCQRKLQVPETLAGQDVQCPTCGATFVARIGGGPPPLSRESQVPPASDRWEGGDRPEAGGPAPERANDEPRPYDERRPARDRREYFGDHDDRGDYPQRRRRDLVPHRGALILTLGILGFVVLPLLCPVAWILGNSDMAEIRAGRMDPEGEGLTQAGRVCGIIGTVIYGLMFCGCGFLFFSALMAPGAMR
jgi:hypothetical protein